MVDLKQWMTSEIFENDSIPVLGRDTCEGGDRVRLEDGQWNGVVEECVDGRETADRWASERGVLVRYDEVGLMFYSDEIEQDVVLVARSSAA